MLKTIITTAEHHLLLPFDFEFCFITFKSPLALSLFSIQIVFNILFHTLISEVRHIYVKGGLLRKVWTHLLQELCVMENLQDLLNNSIEYVCIFL